MQNPSNQKNYDIERDLQSRGYNPLFGKLSLNYPFEPKCYESKFKKDFIAMIQDRFNSLHYYYTDEVKVVITLNFNEQKKYTTPDIGDLDNYAKVICDSLKGVNGIMIDDTQIQSLDICWINTYGDPEFQIIIQSHPDSFSLKPLTLYEMPDGLFYPLSTESWTVRGPEIKSQDTTDLIVNRLKEMTLDVKNMRHGLRVSGSHQNEAYCRARDFSPIIRGYHKNRIIDAGFDIVYLRN